MSGETLLSPGMGEAVAALEQERRRRMGFLQIALLGLVTLVAGTGIAGKFVYHSWQAGWLALFASLLLWGVLAVVLGRRFSSRVRSLVMPDLVRAVGPGLNYTADGSLSLNEFRACGLYQEPDFYQGCDLVEGYVGKTHVRFSLVLAEEEYETTDTVTHTDSDGNSYTETETTTSTVDIFRGLLFSADCNKHFQGRTLLKAGGKNLLGRLRGDFVNLEDPEFNKAFSVYSSDQVEARYLLSTSLMARILELRRRLGRSLEISFAGDRVFVAIPMSLQTFSASLWRRIDMQGTVAHFHSTLQAVVGLVEDLNLNLRIWSKE